MTKEEIKAAIQSAENGANRILAIAKRNVNNQTANLVRKIFNNHFQVLSSPKGAYLTTVPCELPKHKDVDAHKLVFVAADGTQTEADELAFSDCMCNYEMALRAAGDMAKNL